MKKTIFYPYSYDFAPAVRNYFDIKKNIDIFLAAPEGYGIKDKDISYLDGIQQSNYSIYTDTDKLIAICNELCILDNSYDIKFDEYLDIIKKASVENLHITILKEFNIDEKKQINKINPNITYNFEKTTFIVEENIETDTPIIAVAGLGNRTNKFDIQLLLYNELISRGHKVSLVGTKKYCSYLGFNTFPYSIFNHNNKRSDSQQIQLFRQYIKDLSLNESPEIIILGIPLGILPLNDIIHNEFGSLFFKVSQAVDIDYTFLSLYYNEAYTREYLDEMKNLIKYRFGIDVDTFCMGNTRICWSTLREQKKEDNIYLQIPIHRIDEACVKYKRDKIDICNVLNNEVLFKSVDAVIKSLQEYAEMNVF